MNAFLQALLAFVAAMSVATGTPVDNSAPQDRPALVQALPSAQPVEPARNVESEKTERPDTNSQARPLTVNGTITKINGSVITVNGQQLTIGPSAKVEGRLQVGAAVEVEIKWVNGKLTVTHVEVKPGAGIRQPDDSKDKSKSEVKSDDSKDKSKSEVKSDDSKDKSSTEIKSNDDKSKSEVKSDDKSKDKPEDKSKDKPDDKSKEKPDDKSKDKPDDKSKDDSKDDSSHK